MAASISDILNKGMARLSKIADATKAIKEGKPIRLKTAANNLERTQKALERSRQAYIKSVLNARNDILGKDVPMEHIQEGRVIANKAMEEAQQIFSDGWRRRAICEFELLLCDIRETVADIDIDLIVQAASAFDDFIDGLNEYTAAVVAQGIEIDSEKVKKLWAICMPEKNIKALSRASTPCAVIDAYKHDAIKGINEAGTPEQAQAVVQQFLNQLNERFKIWGLNIEFPTQPKE